MQKLTELINQYGKTSNCGPFEDYRIEPATEWNSSYLVLSRDDNGEGDWKDWHLEITRLISKEYGFIKWLVENDKIDFQIWNGEKYLEYPIGSDNYDGVEDYKDIIQWLSISDTPIEDLILYLK